MYSDKYEAQAEYDRWNTRQFKLKLNTKTDKDIIEYIEDLMNPHEHKSMQGTLKRLIRDAIQLEKELYGSV